MTSTTLFRIVFLGSTAYGAYKGVSGLRRMRSRRHYQDTLFEWTDHLPSGPLNEGPIWLAASAHFIGVTLIALATLITIPRRTIAPDFSSLSAVAASFSDDLITALSISLIAYLWGTVLSVNPFYTPSPKEGHYAISAEGILYGGRLFPWSCFTHFSAAEHGGVVRLWSASSPGLVVFVLLPVSSDDQPTLRETLSRYLPTSTSAPRVRSWPRWFLPALTIATSSAAVGASLLLLVYPSFIGLPAAAILTFLLVALGGRMVMQLGFGGMGLPAKVQDDALA
jgi:uncharacterized membrane protein YdbT with pleckstrin-like domain